MGDEFPLIPSQVLEDLKNLEADGIKPNILAGIIGAEYKHPESGPEFVEALVKEFSSDKALNLEQKLKDPSSTVRKEAEELTEKTANAAISYLDTEDWFESTDRILQKKLEEIKLLRQRIQNSVKLIDDNNNLL